MVSHYWLSAETPNKTSVLAGIRPDKSKNTAAGLAPIRVLVADDNTMLRAHIRTLLSRTDDIVVVGEAANGAEAVRLAESIQPDILLLDMEMPVMSGPEVAMLLQEKGSPVRILALSAYNDHEYIAAMISNGASGYLTKDQAPLNVVKAIRSVANGEQVWLS